MNFDKFKEDTLKSLTQKLKIDPLRKKEYEAMGKKTLTGMGKGELPLINLSFSETEIGYGETILQTDPEVATTRDILGSEWDRYHKVVNYYVSNKEMLEQCIDVLVTENGGMKKFNEIPEEFDDLARHFHRMKYTFNRGAKELSNDDFYTLGIKGSTSFCVCKDLEYPWDIYNSDRYIDGTDKYVVKSIGNKQTIFTTKRHPYIENEEELNENKQASISKTEEGDYEVKVNNDNIGIVRRYAIVVSTSKRPIEHYGMFAMVTSSGNKLYIYACDFDTVNYKDDKVAKKLGVWGSSAVILGFGFSAEDMEKQLIKAKDYFDNHCDGRCTILIKPTEKFEEGIDWNDGPVSKKSSTLEFD